MADLALGNQLLRHCQHVDHMCFDLGLVRPAWIKRPDVAEMIAVTIGPMQLIKINIIGFHPPQRGLDRLAQGGTGQRSPAPHLGMPCPCDLAGQNQTAAPATRSQPGTDDLFAAPHGFGLYRIDRIHFSTIPEGYPHIYRQIGLSMAFGFGVLAAPCHGAKTNRRYHKPSCTKGKLLHGRLL